MRWGNPSASRVDLNNVTNNNREGSNNSGDTVQIPIGNELWGVSVDPGTFDDPGYGSFFTDQAGYGLGAVYSRVSNYSSSALTPMDGGISHSFTGDDRASWVSIGLSNSVTDVMVCVGRYIDDEVPLELIDRTTNAKVAGTTSYIIGLNQEVGGQGGGIINESYMYQIIYTNIPDNSAIVMGEGASTAPAIYYVLTR